MMPLWTTTILASAVTVRVGIFFGGAAVRGPTGVADAIGSINGRVPDDFFQVAQLARCAAQVEFSIRPDDGDAGRIVAPVFQLPKAFNNDRNDFFVADVSNDAAHAEHLPRKTEFRVARTKQVTGRKRRSRIVSVNQKTVKCANCGNMA